MTETKLAPEAKLLLEEYLRDWINRQLKFIGIGITAIVAITGFSIVQLAQNTARSTVREDTEYLQEVRDDLQKTVARLAVSSEDLQIRQTETKTAIEETQGRVTELNARAVSMFTEIEQAEGFLKTVGDLSAAAKHVTTSMLADQNFRNSIENRVADRVSGFPEGIVLLAHSTCPAGLKDITAEYTGYLLVVDNSVKDRGRAYNGEGKHSHSEPLDRWRSRTRSRNYPTKLAYAAENQKGHPLSELATVDALHSVESWSGPHKHQRLGFRLCRVNKVARPIQ